MGVEGAVFSRAERVRFASSFASCCTRTGRSLRERASHVRDSFILAGVRRLMRSVRLFGIAVVWVLLACLNAWVMAALYFDFSPAGREWLFPTIYLVMLALLFALAGRRTFRIGVCFTSFLVVLACWLSLKPSNDRNWQLNLSQTPWAEIAGDRVTIHNF
jgi:hypothetical protein